MICRFTEPKIKTYKNNDWCVEYYYQYPPDWPEFPAMRRFRVREGVNYIKDPEEKLLKLEELRKIVKIGLSEIRYSPFDDLVAKKDLIKTEWQRQAEQEAIALKKSEELSFKNAFDWFLEKKEKLGLAKETIRGYTNHLKSFRLWIEDYNKNTENDALISISDITTEIIEVYLESASDASDWTARTYNNNLNSLTTVFGYLKTKKKIQINPLADNVIENRISRAEKNKYYNKTVRKIIQPRLDQDPYLNLFVKWVYYSCMRINELVRLRVCDIDLDLRKINVPPEVGKTGAHIGNRTVPICEELYDIIVKIGIPKCPRHYYVFTLDKKPGAKMLYQEYFRRNYLSIKKELKLDKNYTLYSFKHTRVVDLLAAGYAPQLVMFLTGHTDWASFEKYCRELGAVIDKQLTGKTIAY